MQSAALIFHTSILREKAGMMAILDECELLPEMKARTKITRVKMSVPPVLRMVLFITSSICEEISTVLKYFLKR